MWNINGEVRDWARRCDAEFRKIDDLNTEARALYARAEELETLARARARSLATRIDAPLKVGALDRFAVRDGEARGYDFLGESRLVWRRESAGERGSARE